MENLIKENNDKTTTAINSSTNEMLKVFQPTMLQNIEEFITKYMSIINMDMIDTIQSTLSGHKLNHQQVSNQ